MSPVGAQSLSGALVRSKKWLLVPVLNPAIDRVARVSALTIGAIHRPDAVSVSAGGKGVNAARAAHILSANVRLLLMLGGHAGRWMEQALEEEGLPARAIWLEDETRTCYSIYDQRSGELTEIYERGGTIPVDQWAAFAASFEQEIAHVDGVVLSGSLPTGVPDDAYQILVRSSHRAGLPVFLDTSGDALLSALPENPEVVKINHHELGDSLGISCEDQEGLLSAASRLRRLGAQRAIITQSSEAVYAMDSDRTIRLRPPAIDGGMAVGSGDAFMGALAWSFVSGEPIESALRLAAGVGAANTLTLGAGRFDPGQARRLATECRVDDLKQRPQ